MELQTPTKHRVLRLHVGCLAPLHYASFLYSFDAAASDHYFETFLAESWLEHSRYHEQMTQADRWLKNQIVPCLVDAAETVVPHNLAVIGQIKPSN
jgi:hypothetical protein